MKKILLALCICSISCSKFLEEKPFDFVSPENLGSTAAGAKQMVTGMYSVFFNAQMFHNESWIYLTCSDDDWTNGVDWAMGTYGVGNFAGGWIYNNAGNDPYYVFYRMIRAANGVLEVLPKVKFSAEEASLKTQFEGEALTMRALSYFYIVQMYGPTPLRLHTDDPATMSRSTVAAVYNQIIEDLHVAEGKLTLNSKRTAAIKRGHFTKGAAQLLLAKVYATMGAGALAGGSITFPVTITPGSDRKVIRTEKTVAKNKVAGYDFNAMEVYDSAKAVALRLIATREYEMERYADTWNPANAGGKDFVFALETDSLYPNATTSFNKFFTPPGLLGQGWLRYAKDLYFLYDSADERGRYGIAHEFKSESMGNNGNWRRQFFPSDDSLYYYEKYGTGNVVSGLNSNSCYLMKWYLGNAASPKVFLDPLNAGNIVTNPTQNFPLLRYSEAFLILAEAENERNGPSAVAFNALEVIRQYRFPPENNTMDHSLNQQQLRSYILDERNREFIGEGYRRFDLIRWGIYLQVMNTVNYRAPNLDNQNQIISKKREQKHLLYPVPTIEIDGNTAFGPNNPGW